MSQNINREILLRILRAEPVTVATQTQWQAIVHLALQHGIASLLYWKIKALGLTDQISPDYLQPLHSEYFHTAERNVRIYHEVRSLFEQLQHAGISGILLKGAFLAHAVYGNIAVRPMEDVDVLFKKTDLPHVENIMVEMGYVGEDKLKQRVHETCHFCYTHARHGLRVEAHWDFNKSMLGIRADIDALWERSRAVLLADIPVCEMQPEDHILYLCVHTSGHVFEYGLRAMCDLAETLRVYQETIDWECLRRRAFLWNADRCVYINLRLAKALLNATVSDDWLNAIKPADFEMRYLTLAQDHLFASVEETEKALATSSKVIQIWAAERMTRKLTLLWQNLIPSRQMMDMTHSALPYSLRIFLHFPVRLKDLLKNHGRVVWQLLRRDEQTHSRAERQNQINRLRSWLLSK